MTGIKAIINDNASTTMFAGKVKFYSMLEEKSMEYLKRIRRNGSKSGILRYNGYIGFGSAFRKE